MTNGEKFTCALKAAIDGQARVYDYGHRDTFVRLWTMGEDGCPNAFNGNEQPGQGQESGCNPPNARDEQSCSPERVIGKPIVIVWDGRPLDGWDEGSNTLKPHLTPMDWALAFSIHSLTKEEVPEEKAPECADVAIHIVDLTGEAHKAWSMRMRHQLLAEMPWVTLHAPLIPKGAYRSAYRPVLEGCGSLLKSSATGWTLRAGTGTLKGASSGYGRNLKELSRQWSSTLVQSHDHHDLNNLVGPSILLGQTPETLPLLSAFRNRLFWSKFLRPISLSEDKPNFSVLGELDALTIDDQLLVGWHHVICGLFGAKISSAATKFKSDIRLIGSTGDIQLYGSDGARPLLKSLMKMKSLMKKDLFEKRCFDSPIPCSGNERPWLLALDLLLFPGDPRRERKWLTELLCIARSITGSSSLAWPEISETELKDVEKWLESRNVEDPAYNTALSLLPRLCALRWPSVPILLFSGTSRRALTDKLAPYRNIFLAPQKPNLLSGNASEETEAFLIGWRRELVSTKGLIAVQRKLLQLQRQGKTEPASVDCTGNGQVSIAKEEADGSAESKQDVEQQQHDRSVRHLTIALDESGNFKSDRHSAVGGVVIEACSSSEKTAKKLTFDFLERLRQQGVNFYNHPPAYTEIGKKGDVVCDSTIKKGSDVSTMIKEVLPEFDNRIRIGAFRCRVSEEAYESSGPPDSTYLKWLVRTLELLLCEYLASKGYELQTTSISLWLPTRNITGDCDRSRATRFDLFSITDKRMVTVGGRSLAYAIVLRSLEGRLGYNILEKAS